MQVKERDKMEHGGHPSALSPLTHTHTDEQFGVASFLITSELCTRKYHSSQKTFHVFQLRIELSQLFLLKCAELTNKKQT